MTNKLYWGPKPSRERHRALAQGHLSLVERAVRGKLDAEARDAYVEILKWQLGYAREHSLSARASGSENPPPLEDPAKFRDSITATSLLNCKEADDRLTLLKESRGWVMKLFGAGIFRVEHGTFDEIEGEIAGQLRAESFFQKLDIPVVVAEEGED